MLLFYFYNVLALFNQCTVKLGYNKQFGKDQICSLPGFIITGLFCVVKWSFETVHFYMITA